ncbi:hypothetical protein AOLI_G00079200 [Acnodon oligacanthus]
MSTRDPLSADASAPVGLSLYRDSNVTSSSSTYHLLMGRRQKHSGTHRSNGHYNRAIKLLQPKEIRQAGTKQTRRIYVPAPGAALAQRSGHGWWGLGHRPAGTERGQSGAERAPVLQC